MQMPNEMTRDRRRFAVLIPCMLPGLAWAQYATGLVSDWGAVVLLGPWLLLIGLAVWAGCAARFAYRTEMLRAVLWPIALFIAFDACLIAAANLGLGSYTELAFMVALYVSMLSGPLLLIASSLVFVIALRLKRRA